MLVVALTGGIASGKSTVSKRLKQLGAVILDADQISREVVRPGEPALEEIRRAFGDKVLSCDGTLNRPLVGQIIFNDPKKRKQLENIIHPRVRQKMKDDLDALRRDGTVPVVICDIPLLFETGMNLEAFDRVLVVYAPKDRQLRRLMERNRFTEEEALLRIQSQIPTEEKVCMADDVIDNSGNIDETLQQVDHVWDKWQRLMSPPPEDETI